MSGETEFSDKLTCGHCGNIAPARILTRAKVDSCDETGFWEESVYETLQCPSCEKVIFREIYYDAAQQAMEEGRSIWIHYPTPREIPSGLPEKIKNAYEAAIRVERIDVHAYAVLLRRVLELVCKDRQAEGRVLADFVKNLAERGEIPEKLTEVASYLRHFGNVGAHAGDYDLDPQAVPLLRDLTNAVLEYVYAAPHLIARAQRELNRLKRKKQ